MADEPQSTGKLKRGNYLRRDWLGRSCGGDQYSRRSMLCIFVSDPISNQPGPWTSGEEYRKAICQ